MNAREWNDAAFDPNRDVCVDLRVARITQHLQTQHATLLGSHIDDSCLRALLRGGKKRCLTSLDLTCDLQQQQHLNNNIYGQPSVFRKVRFDDDGCMM